MVKFPFYSQASEPIDVLQESKERLSHCEKNLNSADRELFDECAKIVKTFLSNEPFSLFRSSMYFHRYLQWKWLERSVARIFFTKCPKKENVSSR